MWGIEVEAGYCGLIYRLRCQHKARLMRALFFVLHDVRSAIGNESLSRERDKGTLEAKQRVADRPGEGKRGSQIQ